MIKGHMSKIRVKIRNLTYSFYLYISYLVLIKPYDTAGNHKSTCGYPPVLHLTKTFSSTYSIMSRFNFVTAFILFATVISGKLTTNEVEYIKTPSKNVETKFREFTKASRGTRSDDDEVLNREKRVAPLIIGGIMGTLLGGGIGGYENAIGDIFQGLRCLEAGELSPTLVNPVNLRSSLEKIDSEANRRRQNIAVNSVNELYTLPITLVRSHSTRLTITVDIPLFELRNRLSLWEYVSTPTEVKNATKTYGQAYYFRPENPYLALANDLYFREYSIEELNRCTQIQGTFLCHSTVLTRDTRHSCLYTLYKGEHTMMEEE